MRFGLTEEQELFGRSLRGFLADRLATDRDLFIIDSCYAGTGTRGATPGGRAKEVVGDWWLVVSCLETSFACVSHPAPSMPSMTINMIMIIKVNISNVKALSFA